MELYFRYALELAVLVPGVIFAFLPVRGKLKFSRWILYPMVALVTGAIIFVGAWLCIRYDFDSNRVLFLTLPFLLILFCAVVDLSLPKALFCFLTGCTLAGFCTLYTSYLTAPIEPVDGPFSYTSSTVVYILAVLIGIFFFKTLHKRLPELFAVEGYRAAWWYFLLAPFLTSVLIYWATPLSLANVLVGRIRQISLVMMLFFPLFFYAFCYLLWWLTNNMLRAISLQQENDLLQIERKRYESLQRYLDATRTMRHDFRQHLAVIGELNQAGENEKLTQYLHELNQTSSSAHRRYCRNRIVDALAFHYDELAAAQDTVIEWTLNLPEVLSITEVEYSAMLGNLLENALHAVAALPTESRKVRVGSEMPSDGILTLCVDNPYTGRIRMGRDGLPRARQSGHGVGLHSVASTVNRYHGTMEIRTENGMFSVEIVLYSRSEE